jgi:hypothetical protein
MSTHPPVTDSPIARLLDPGTITLDVVDVAELLGISRPHCYHTIAETGLLAGIAAIRIGSRIKIPAEPIRRLLGLNLAAITVSEDSEDVG